MGYEVNKLKIYSIDDNRTYNIPKPEEDSLLLQKFENVIKQMREIDINTFEQKNKDKCMKCIYEPACDRSLAI